MNRQEKHKDKSTANPQSCKLADWALARVLILVGAFGIGSGAWTFLQSFNCKSWPTTEGVVETVTISPGKGRRANISYHYHVAGTSYKSTRLAFGEDMTQGQWILNRYPAGTKVTVRYSPSEPQLAVLETGVHGGTWTHATLGAIFGVFGWMLLGFRGASSGGGRTVKLHQPPIQLGVIFVLMGAGCCLRELSRRAASGWIGYVAGGFFILCGVVLLACRWRGKPFCS